MSELLKEIQRQIELGNRITFMALRSGSRVSGPNIGFNISRVFGDQTFSQNYVVSVRELEHARAGSDKLLIYLLREVDSRVQLHIDQKARILPRFQTMNGEPTTAEDPMRAVWYSVGCCYWTDDWTKVTVKGSGIPVCPFCSSPGYYGEIGPWLLAAKMFEERGRPEVDGVYASYLDGPQNGYHDWLLKIKEHCYNQTIADAWRLRKANPKAYVGGLPSGLEPTSPPNPNPNTPSNDTPSKPS